MTVVPIIGLRAGLGLRDPAHADPQWYEMDLDDLIEDPDEPDFDPLPTARHRQVPGFET